MVNVHALPPGAGLDFSSVTSLPGTATEPPATKRPDGQVTVNVLIVFGEMASVWKIVPPVETILTLGPPWAAATGAWVAKSARARARTGAARGMARQPSRCGGPSMIGKSPATGSFSCPHPD